MILNFDAIDVDQPLALSLIVIKVDNSFSWLLRVLYVGLMDSVQRNERWPKNFDIIRIHVSIQVKLNCRVEKLLLINQILNELLASCSVVVQAISIEIDNPTNIDISNCGI